MQKKHDRRWQVYGENHHSAKLTDREVYLLRDLRADGFTYRQLANVFEISKSQVANIVLRRQRH